MKAKYFNVFGLTVPVYYQDLSQTTSGEFVLKEIKIDKSLRGYESDHAHIHELGHALFERIGLSQTGISRALSGDLEEIIVDSFATVMVENFRLYPRFK